MGESKRKREVALATQAAMAVTHWVGACMCAGTKAREATPNGQLVFFAEFLATAGIFEHWVDYQTA